MRPKIYETAKITPETVLVMAEDTFIGDFCLIHCERLELGQGSQINSGTKIVGGGVVKIGRNVVISYNCVLLTATDTPEGRFMNDASPLSERRVRRGDIIIADNAFIGANSIVMPNLKIGERAVIGAGSYIDKDVLPNIVVISKKEHSIRPRDAFDA